MNSQGLPGGNAAGSAMERLANHPPKQKENKDIEQLLQDMWSTATQDVSSIAPGTSSTCNPPTIVTRLPP
jgi:hypothetical protein